MKTAWVRLALVCVAATAAAAVAVEAGPPGNGQRDGRVDVRRGPGPWARDVRREHRLQGDVHEHRDEHVPKVTFRMRYPYIEKGTEPYQQAGPSGRGAHVSDDADSRSPVERVQRVGLHVRSLTPGTPDAEQLVVSVVWQRRSDAAAISTVNCPTDCGEPAGLPRLQRSMDGQRRHQRPVRPERRLPARGKDVRGGDARGGDAVTGAEGGRRLRAAEQLHRPARSGKPSDEAGREPRQPGLDDGLYPDVRDRHGSQRRQARCRPRPRDHDRRGERPGDRTRRILCSDGRGSASPTSA